MAPNDKRQGQDMYESQEKKIISIPALSTI